MLTGLLCLQTKMLTQEQGIDGAVKKYGVDAFFAPSGGVAWYTDLVNGDCGVFESSSLAAVAGYPNITVPGRLRSGIACWRFHSLDRRFQSQH